MYVISRCRSHTHTHTQTQIVLTQGRSTTAKSQLLVESEQSPLPSFVVEYLQPARDMDIPVLQGMPKDLLPPRTQE